MEKDDEQETIDRIKALLKRTEEIYARGHEDAIEFHADMRARIQMMGADQQRAADLLKGMKNEY